MQQSRHPDLRAVHERLRHRRHQAQSVWEINQNGGEVTSQFGGDPTAPGLANVWKSCTRTQDPDVICRNKFRWEIRANEVKLFANGVLYYQAGLIDSEMNNILQAPGGVLRVLWRLRLSHESGSAHCASTGTTWRSILGPASRAIESGPADHFRRRQPLRPPPAIPTPTARTAGDAHADADLATAQSGRFWRSMSPSISTAHSLEQGRSTDSIRKALSTGVTASGGLPNRTVRSLHPVCRSRRDAGTVHSRS